MKTKKFLAMLLAFAMVLTSMSIGVFAEEGTEDTAGISTVTVSTEEELNAAIADKGDGDVVVINLAADITLTKSLIFPNGIIATLYGNGYTLSCSYIDENSHIRIETMRGATLNLGSVDEPEKSKLTITTAREDNVGSNLLYALDSTMNMYDGVVLKDFVGVTDNNFPAAVFISIYKTTEAAFNMYGGTITNCRNEAVSGGFTFGGAVYVDGAEFNMYDGTITGNSAEVGGAIAVGFDGVANIYNGYIADNTSTGGGHTIDMFTWVPGEVEVSGGSFDEGIPAEYIADGCFIRRDDAGSYTVKSYEDAIADEVPQVSVAIGTPISEVSSISEDITVVPMTEQLIEGADAMLVDAVVEYVTKNPDATEIEVYRKDNVEFIESSNNENGIEKSTITVEITPYVVVVEEGVETEIEINTKGIMTTVRVPLPVGYEVGDKVSVKHILDSGKTEVFENIEVETDGTITYIDVATENGFSTWIISAPENVNDVAAEIADALKIELVKHSDNEKVYDIMLRGKNVDDTASKYIYRWTSAEMDFVLTPATNSMTNQPYDFEYKITPGTNIEYENIDGVDKFNMNGTVASDASGYSIKLGEIEFTGYGTFDFGIATPANAMAQTAVYEETDDSINRTYKKDANLTDKRAGEFLIGNNSNGTVDNLLDDVLITETLEKVTIVIENNNKIKNQQIDYQDMTLTIDAKDNNYDKTIRLGSDYDVSENVAAVGKGVISVAYDTTTTNYTVEVMLPVDRRYTFKVEGAGYRTSAKDYTISGEDTAINKVTFWNNAKKEDGTDFLAGEIVKDGKINIYDLSAVVSYFNTKDIKVNATDNPTTPDVNEASYYRTYDLNRDGKIDTIDISYLLLSWGK